MKTLLFSIFACSFFSGLANATQINTTLIDQKFSQHLFILQDQLVWGENTLDEYLEEELGCNKVRFNPQIKRKAGIFKPGAFDLTLTANCSQEFSDFKFDIKTNFHDSDYIFTEMYVSFVKNGILVKRKFKTSWWQ